MTSPSNPSAFPHVNPSFDDNWNKERQVEGMSLRDYIAVAVLQAILTNSPNGITAPITRAPITAYEFADAMLTAREKS